MSRAVIGIIVVVCVGAAALLATLTIRTNSTEAIANSEKCRTYTSEKSGMSLTFPEAWLRSADFEDHLIKLVAPTHPDAIDTGVLLIHAFDLPKDVSGLREIGEWKMKQETSHLSDYSRTEPTLTTINGLPAYKAGFFFYSTGTERMEHHINYYFVWNGQGIVIRCAAGREDFDCYAAEFENIVQSFKMAKRVKAVGTEPRT